MYSNYNKIPFWNVYEIWEYHQIQKDQKVNRESQSKLKEEISNEENNLVQMVQIQEVLYILIQDEQNYLYQYNTNTNTLKFVTQIDEKFKIRKMISDGSQYLYFFSLNCQNSYFSNYRYTLYRFNTQKEIFDEVNAGGIPPKERECLNSVFHNNKIYVFGSDSTFSQGEIQDSQLKQQFQQQTNIYVFDLLQEEWVSKEVPEIEIPKLCSERYCNYAENLFYLEKSLNMTVVKRNLESLQGQKHVFGYLKNRKIQDQGLLCASDNHLYIYDIDSLYKIENIAYQVTEVQNTLELADQKQLQLIRLNQGVILTECLRSDIHLKGFKVISGILYSLVQIKNKIALLSISQNDLKDLNEEAYLLKQNSNLHQAHSDQNQINQNIIQQIQDEQQNRQKELQKHFNGQITVEQILQEQIKNQKISNKNVSNNKNNKINNSYYGQSLEENDISVELINYFNQPTYSDLRFKFENNNDMYCNKQLLSYYSKYFRKHLSDPDLLIVKINDVSFTAFQLLIQQFYYQFTNDMPVYDYNTIIDLFNMANKFSIPILQEKCESLITISENNFKQIIPLIKKVSTYSLKEKCIEFMKRNKQFLNSEYMKSFEKSDLILLLTWLNNKQCQHKKTIKILSELKSNYQYNYSKVTNTKGVIGHSATSSQDLQLTNNKNQQIEGSQQSQQNVAKSQHSQETQETFNCNKYKSFSGIIKEGNLEIHICLNCKMVLNYE
ncbi:hypothetical protein ABPG72_017386 [Tetrahymena utriculariae]